MTSTAWWLIGLALLIAFGDWVAVAAGAKVAEYVLKPATMVPLIAAALVLHPVRDSARAWFVAALVLSLAGDVFLMLPDVDRFFVPGLGSFLLAHIAYIVGLVAADVNGVGLAVGAVVVAIAVSSLAPRVITGARAHDRRLALPVLIYVLVISIMVACAIGSVVPAAVAGAALFYLSDLTIGWTRFVRDIRGGRLIIITTYHVAQVLLVISLTVAR